MIPRYLIKFVSSYLVAIYRTHGATTRRNYNSRYNDARLNSQFPHLFIMPHVLILLYQAKHCELKIEKVLMSGDATAHGPLFANHNDDEHRLLHELRQCQIEKRSYLVIGVLTPCCCPTLSLRLPQAPTLP